MNNDLVVSAEILRYHHIGPHAHFTHDHDTYGNWVLVGVEAGCFGYTIGPASGEAKPGDILLCPPGMTFYRKTIQPVSVHFFEFHWKLPGEEQLPLLGNWAASPFNIRDLKRLMSTFDYLRAIYNVQYTESHRFANHLLEDLLYLFLMERQMSTVHLDPVIDRAAAYIREHAHEPLSVGLVAYAFQLSQSQFSKRFQAAIGELPSSYMTRVRMERACELLLRTEHTLEHIAEQCGYQTGFYLSRVFSKIMGMSPSEYRKAHRLQTGCRL